MIKASELRVGNWVNVPHGNVQIEEITKSSVHFTDGCGATFPSLTPIEITSEILENAGFVNNGQGIFDKKGFFTYIRKRGSWYQVCNVGDCSFKYLHEFQNLYFALTRKELENLKIF